MENIANQSWDFLKWILTGVVTGLSFIMVYFFNQINNLKDQMNLNRQSILLNDQHDKTTDSTLSELKVLIERLDSKLDQIILKQK
jgi:hypothetical protein